MDPIVSILHSSLIVDGKSGRSSGLFVIFFFLIKVKQKKTHSINCVRMSSYKEERTEYNNVNIVQILCELQFLALTIYWMESVKNGGLGCEQCTHLWQEMKCTLNVGLACFPGWFVAALRELNPNTWIPQSVHL